MMATSDQIRLNVIRSEVLRIRNGITNLNHMNDQRQVPNNQSGSILHRILGNRSSFNDVNESLPFNQSPMVQRMRHLIETHLNSEYFEYFSFSKLFQSNKYYFFSLQRLKVTFS